MKLSELESVDVLIDGEFEILAQCSVKMPKKILSFLEDTKFINEIKLNENISCIICREDDVKLLENMDYGILISENPRLTFFKIHNEFTTKKKNFKSSIDETSIIAETAIISEFNVVIGKNVIIEDHVIIKENVYVGDNSIIRSGCVIGGQGYEFKRIDQQSVYRVTHFGHVKVGNNVELKEYVTIHTALFNWDETSIGNYSKIDAHSHIGHGTKVGERVFIGSHGNLAGNIIVENDIFIGPGVTVSNRVTVGSGAKLTLGSVVNRNVPLNQTVSGNFAIPHNIFLEDLKLKLLNNSN